jgi:hypothetical protein
MKSMLTEYETEKWIRLEYRVLREADGVCSRCRKRRAITAHHTTYEHGILCPPEFLMAVWPLCHGYLHGKIDRDPAAFKLDWPDEMRFKLNEASGGWLWRKETREGWKKG